MSSDADCYKIERDRAEPSSCCQICSFSTTGKGMTRITGQISTFSQLWLMMARLGQGVVDDYWTWFLVCKDRLLARQVISLLMKQTNQFRYVNKWQEIAYPISSLPLQQMRRDCRYWTLIRNLPYVYSSKSHTHFMSQRYQILIGKLSSIPRWRCRVSLRSRSL